jgi:hypothetical protein
MKFSSLATYGLTVTTGAAMLAACSNSGGSSLAPSGTSSGIGITHVGRMVMVNGFPITAAHPNLRAHRGGVISPDIKLYQYISNMSSSSLLVFDYPIGDSAIGSISGVTQPLGECTDVTHGVGTGTFWVAAAGANEFEEFKAGGKSPIATLSESVGAPGGCAINPTTGDLAGTILGTGDVIIYPKARPPYTVKSDGLSSTYFDGYDNHGNLWVDGLNGSGSFQLEKCTPLCHPMTLSNTVSFPGAVQFDGRYITVNDQENKAIYGYTCVVPNCTLKRTVKLMNSSDCVQTWIVNTIVFCPDAGNNDVEVYKYPGGGSSVATLTGTFATPVGAVDATP